MDLTCRTEETREVKLEKVDFDYFPTNTNIKTEPLEEASEGLEEQLLMEWSEDRASPDQTFIALLNSATFVMDGAVSDIESELSQGTQEKQRTPRKSSKPKEEKSADQFNCDVCSRKYWKRSKLEAHMRTQHAKKEKVASTRSPDERADMT